MTRKPFRKWLFGGGILLLAGLSAYWVQSRAPGLSSADFTKFSQDPGKMIAVDQWRVVSGDFSGYSEMDRSRGKRERRQSWLVEGGKPPDPQGLLVRLKEQANLNVTHSEVKEDQLVVEYTGYRSQPLIRGSVTYEFREAPSGRLAVQCRLVENIGTP